MAYTASASVSRSVFWQKTSSRNSRTIVNPHISWHADSLPRKPSAKLWLRFRDGVSLRTLGIGHDAFGKPLVVYHGPALETINRLGISESLLSISDERDYALAFAILLRR